jgi:hypothetical protein
MAGMRTVPVWASPREFWDEKQPHDWTPSEIEQLLSKSPWAKEASISYSTGQRALLGGGQRAGGTVGRRGGNRGTSGGGASSAGTIAGDPGGSWKAMVRWESALPVREALGGTSSSEFAENYVINMIGAIPSVGLPADDDDPAERKQKLELLQETTRIERRDDPLELQGVATAPATRLSRGGTLFYFSRILPIKPADKQVTFVTKMGGIEIKCKFTLKEMQYRGNLEL